MLGVLSGFAVVGTVIAVGWALARWQVLAPSARQTLATLVFTVATPALLFETLATTSLTKVFSPTLWIALVSALVTGVVAVLVARWLLGEDWAEAIVTALSSSYVNAGNLGIPIALYVLGDATFVAPLLLFQTVLYGPVALTALDVLTGRGRGAGFTRVLLAPLQNPIAIGGIAGLVVSAIGLRLPGPVLEPFHLIGQLSVPGALLTFGLGLHGARVLERGGPRAQTAVATALKMVAMPVLAFVVARWGFGQTGHALFGSVVIAALPTAQNVYVYAMRYRRGEIVARDTGLVSTLLAIPVLCLVAVLLAR